MYRIYNSDGQLIFLTRNLKSASVMYKIMVHRTNGGAGIRVMKDNIFVKDVNELFKYFL